jgi:hypothetical protein
VVATPLERSSELPLRPNPPARASLLVGILAVVVLPAAIASSRYLEEVTLVNAGIAAPVAALLGIVAIALARRGRRRIERTLWSTGGARLARTGRALGLLAVCLAFTAGVALGFYGLLLLFAE